MPSPCSVTSSRPKWKPNPAVNLPEKRRKCRLQKIQRSKPFNQKNTTHKTAHEGDLMTLFFVYANMCHRVQHLVRHSGVSLTRDFVPKFLWFSGTPSWHFFVFGCKTIEIACCALSAHQKRTVTIQFTTCVTKIDYIVESRQFQAKNNQSPESKVNTNKAFALGLTTKQKTRLFLCQILLLGSKWTKSSEIHNHGGQVWAHFSSIFSMDSSMSTGLCSACAVSMSAAAVSNWWPMAECKFIARVK